MRKKLLLSGVLMILYTFPIYSQKYTAEIDSLWRVARDEGTSIDDRLEVLHKLGKGKRIDSVITALEEIRVSPVASDNYYQVYIYQSMCSLNLKGAEYKKAMLMCQKAEQIVNEKFDTDSIHLKLKGSVFHSMGRVYSTLGNKDKGIDYALRAAEYHKLCGNFSGVTAAYNNVGSYFAHRSDTREGVKYYEKALHYAELAGSKEWRTFILINIAKTHVETGKQSIVDSLLNVAEKHDSLINDSDKYNILYVRALAESNRGNYYKTLELHKEVEQYYKAQNDVRNISLMECIIGDTYKKLKQYNQSIKYCLKCYETTKDYIYYQRNGAESLAKSYEETGNYKEALKYAKIFATLQDSLFNQEKTKALTELSMQHEFDEEKAQTEAEYQLKLQRQRSIQYGMAGGLALLGLVLFFAYRAYRIKQKANQTISKQNTQLEQLNQTKDRIFGIIGHDLKKPAIAFRGIAKKVNYLLKKEQYDRLLVLGESIEKDAHALNILTDNLLKWALLQREILPNDATETEIQPIVEDVFSIFDRVASEKNIRLNANILPEHKVLADKNALSTIIRNLVDNAVKFTPEGGEVNVCTTETKDGILISIRDTGVGMSADKIQDIFLLKKEKTTEGTSGEKGTGLGLHLVHELVRQINGSIRVQSQVNEGTAFVVTLPVSGGG